MAPSLSLPFLLLSLLPLSLSLPCPRPFKLTSSNTSSCPSSSLFFSSPSGVPGSLSLASPSSSSPSCPSSLLFSFSANSPGFLNSFVGDVATCRQLCVAWPYQSQAPKEAKEGKPYDSVHKGQRCSYWTYDGAEAKRGPHGGVENAPTCYLFDKKACGPKSYIYNPVEFPNSRSGGIDLVLPTAAAAAAARTTLTSASSTNKFICSISDTNLHVNFLYAPSTYGATNQQKVLYNSVQITSQQSLGLVRKVGILWNQNIIELGIRESGTWQFDDSCFISIKVNGDDVKLKGSGAASVFSIPSVDISYIGVANQCNILTSTTMADSYQIKLGTALTMVLTIRTEADLTATGATDERMYFDVEVKSLVVSKSAKGMFLWSPLASQATVSESSGLLRADCSVAGFKPPFWKATQDPASVLNPRRRNN